MRVRGARTNNLRDIDVELPLGRLVAFTGVSGSGKSSLAFGTIHAEAQRRYLESVAPYAARLLRRVEAPDVDAIESLPPTVGLEQRRFGGQSRSTVGTLTTIDALLRLLFSRVGVHPRAAPERLPAEAFSPNTAAGACPRCEGLGQVVTVTERSMVPDPSLSIREGAIAAWPGAWQGKNLRDIAIALGYDVDVPWRQLDRADRRWLLFTDEQPVVEVEPGPERNEYPYNGTFVGAKRHVLQTLAHSKSERMRERALQFVLEARCPSCKGQRLAKAALAVKYRGLDIAAVRALPLRELDDVLRARVSKASDRTARGKAERMILEDVVARLAPLMRMGLGYLSCQRSSSTLSGGELQRLRVAAQLHAGLYGVVYVLDEPAAGLHPADADTLYEVLRQLVEQGNSVLVVEHTMALVRRCDWLVDVGPGSGTRGGAIVHSGEVEALREVEASVTRPYLFEDGGSPRPEPAAPRGWLELSGITRHNLRQLSVRIPIGCLTAVTGVSGSGKTTLVASVLPALMGVGEPSPPRGARITGAEALHRTIVVDHGPIGRTPRSNLATYTGLFDHVRARFAATAKARRRGWGPGRFSFNVAKGRCPQCAGEGWVSVELVFLPSTHAPCPSCEGRRYAPETLEVELEGLNIAEVLSLRVDEAREHFAGDTTLVRALTVLRDVGLGYLELGRPAPTLSGGEAQRIKLAAELQRLRAAPTLFVLDEPTSSLHPADVDRLALVLRSVVDRGHTVVVAEHDLRIIRSADWVVDLGPGGGDEGGRLVASGTPADVARARDSATGRLL